MHQIPKKYLSHVLLDEHYYSSDRVNLPEIVTIGDTLTDPLCKGTKYKVKTIVEDWESAYKYIVLANQVYVPPMWFHVDRLILDSYEVDLQHVPTNDTDCVKLGDKIPGYEGYTISLIVKHNTDEGYTVYATSEETKPCFQTSKNPTPPTATGSTGNSYNWTK